MLSLYWKILTECGNNSQNNVLSIVTGLTVSMKRQEMEEGLVDRQNWMQIRWIRSRLLRLQPAGTIWGIVLNVVTKMWRTTVTWKRAPEAKVRKMWRRHEPIIRYHRHRLFFCLANWYFPSLFSGLRLLWLGLSWYWRVAVVVNSPDTS